jgi:hypothetical protein
LARDELVFEHSQVRVIKLKLDLEGTIGQAAPLAQQRDRLIHDGDKVHSLSSFPGAGSPEACVTPS